MNVKKTGLFDEHDCEVELGDTVAYKNGEYKVDFKNYSWVLVSDTGWIRTYFKDIRSKVCVIRRGLK